MYNGGRRSGRQERGREGSMEGSDILTERLRITMLNPGMAEDVCRNSLDEDMRRFVPDEVFETPGEARSAILRLIGCYTGGGPLVYPVLLHGGENIGYVQAVPIGSDWEIGYHIAAGHTGNGYATEAVRAFLPRIMDRLRIGRIFGICRADNKASRAVLEKCGFALESIGPGNYKGGTHRICRYVFQRQ